MTRKTVHLITSLRGGGTENFLYQILLKAPPAEVPSVAYLQEDGVIGDRIRALGIEVTRTPTPWHVADYLKLKKPDVLHTCLYWANQMGRWMGHRQKVPLILSSQRAIQVWEQPWHPVIDRWTLPWCQAVIANSRPAQELVESRLKTHGARPILTRIPNGLDFEKFRARDRDAARRHFQIPDGMIAGGTLARLHHEKGAEKIPDFAQRVLSTHPRVVLLVAGTGPLEAELKEKTAQWKDRVRYVGWQEDSPRFLSALDFFWMLSREESFPQALLEASGAGLPWVAPEIGDISELQKAGAAGLLYPVNDMDAAAGQCTVLIKDADGWKGRASQALARLEGEYSLGQMAQRFYSFVDQMQSKDLSK